MPSSTKSSTATAHNIVIKALLVELPLPIKAQEVQLSGPRSLDASRKLAAQRTFLVREQRSFR